MFTLPTASPVYSRGEEDDDEVKEEGLFGNFARGSCESTE